MKLKALLIDLDDTIYTSFNDCLAHAYDCVAAYATRELGVDGAQFIEIYQQYREMLTRMQPGMPPIHDRVIVAQGALERMGLNAIRHARTIHCVYWDALLSKMQLNPGVPELFDRLRAEGVKIAVCTDMLADIQMKKLEQLGLADKVDFMVSSEEAGQDKPASPIFRLALAKCNCLAQQAVMLGDNFRHDVQGAMDTGITGIWLNWNNQPRIADKRRFFEVDSFPAAADLITSFLGNIGE